MSLATYGQDETSQAASNTKLWRVVAYGAPEQLLRRLVESALKIGFELSALEYKKREDGRDEARFHYRVTAVVNTAASIKRTWQGLAMSRKIACRFADPVEVQLNSTGPDEGLTEADLSEIFGEEASVQGAELKNLAKLVNRYVEVSSEIEALDEQCSERTKELSDLRTNKLPELMRSARITKQDMDSGHRVALSPTAAGTWPKDEPGRAKAMKALAALDSQKLVKQVVTVTLPADDPKLVAQVLKYLRSKKLAHEVDRTVHTMTYRAWAKEMMEDKKRAPIFLSMVDDLNLLVIDQATVKLIKK